MARYKLTERAFINDRLCEAQEEVEVADHVIPGPHMQPVDKAAGKAVDAAGPRATEPVGDILEGIGIAAIQPNPLS